MDVSRVRADALGWGGQYADPGRRLVALLSRRDRPPRHGELDAQDVSTVRSSSTPVLGRIVDYYLAVSRRIFDAAADAIDIFFIGNDFGTQNGPVVGGALFRRFFLPHLERLIDLGHDFGLKVMLHCCGGFYPLIPRLDRRRAGRPAVAPARRPGHGARQAQARFRRPDRLSMAASTRTTCSSSGTPGARPRRSAGCPRDHEAGRGLHRLAQPRLSPARDAGRERPGALRGGEDLRKL